MHVNCLSVPVVYCCTGYLFSAAFRRICRFTAPSGATVFCVITLFTPLSPIISDLPFFFFSDEQINIRLGHLLSPMHNRFLYRFSMLFSIFPELFFILVCFYLLHFLRLIFWMFLQLFSKRSLLYVTAFSLTCNPLSTLNCRHLKCFPSLCRIFFQLYSIKYVYSKVDF